MTLSLLVLAWSFHEQTMLGSSMGIIATACLMIYITCFAFSMGPIAWIIVAEVFPLRLRGSGAAAATLGSGASNFLVSATFLSLINAAGNTATFCIYGAFCIVTLLFVRFVMPETRGCELESISAEPQPRQQQA
jgi:Sugar (and other) transporter